MLVEHEKDVTVVFDELVKLFIQMKFRQQLSRRKLPSDTKWSTSGASSELQAVRHSILKLLRMAAVTKYIMQYHRLSQGSPPVTRQPASRQHDR